MTASQRLSALRKTSGVSQEELAEQLNVTRQTISRWENGASIPSAENLARLSEMFQVPMEAFLRDDWVPPEETAPAVQVVEAPVEVQVPVEVPVSRPKYLRLLALIAAAALAVGILVGAIFFREPPEKSAPIVETESEVISSSEDQSEDVIPEAELDVSEVIASTPVLKAELLPLLPDSSDT